MVIPPKLRTGDTVAVIAPSSSFGSVDQETRTIAEARFRALGLNVLFAEHIEEMDDFGSSSIPSRLADLHATFADPQVKAIFAARGGWSANQLLRGIDWDLIRRNPKIVCGFSNITALDNAVYAKTGMLTYYGPGYSTFGLRHDFDYTLEYLKKCLMSAEPFRVEPSRTWSDDFPQATQTTHEQVENEGCVVLTEGAAEGVIVGGCLCDLTTLQGTAYMPNLDGAILFLEDDRAATPRVFDRALQSLLLQPNFSGVRGMIVGRFQRESGMTADMLARIIRNKRELTGIPVIANADFGHTNPKITFPIGGIARLQAENEEIVIEILTH